MKLAIIYSGKYAEKVEGIAKELGGTFSKEPSKVRKDFLRIEVNDGEELSFEGPLREYSDVPIGFVESLTQNLKAKRGKEANVSNGDEIVITVSSKEDLSVLRWLIWYYLEGLVDKEIGRMWF